MVSQILPREGFRNSKGVNVVFMEILRLPLPYLPFTQSERE